MPRILFLHPDLGIGGAERLVVDAALALKQRGHHVKFVTNHYDPSHAFDEIKNGTIPVEVVGDWLPRHVFGRFYAFWAYLRMMYAALYIIFSSPLPDLVFCDQVSVCIPLLRLRVPRVIFYCHHPDQVLSAPGGCFKSLYRLPLNYMEEFTTGLADKIFVNSVYTLSVFKSTFTSLKVEPEVLYPSLNCSNFDRMRVLPLERVLDCKMPNDKIVLLSINRYERKKHLHLAIEGLAALESRISPEMYKKIYLVMAGGYDKRVEENVEHYLELIGLADELRIAEKVIFLRSPSDTDKISLLAQCALLIYTPANEHFGIVPLEAMYMRKPVVCQNSGGPKESVLDGSTGYLVQPTGEAFAERIAELIQNPKLAEQMGCSGRQRFDRTFSFDAFGFQLNESVEKLIV